MSLEKLSRNLLYNSIIEVWIALCNDLNYDWQNLKMFNSFISFLQNNNFEIKSLGVCPSGSGPKEQFEKRTSILLGNPNSSFVIKTNSETLDKLSKFTCDI